MPVARGSGEPVPFTKGQVNRAGEVMLALRQRAAAVGVDAALVEFDGAQLERAGEALRWWRSLHARPLTTVAANLRYHVDQADARLSGEIAVAQRLKRLPTMIEKLEREQGRVTQMHDIGGARAVVPAVTDVYAVRRRLRKSWTIIRERDYIEKPKDSGYRALHLIVQRKGFAIEVQLRSGVQDIWANIVEEVGRERGIGLKFGAGDADVLRGFAAVSELLARFERGEVVVSADELREAVGEAMRGTL